MTLSYAVAQDIGRQIVEQGIPITASGMKKLATAEGVGVPEIIAGLRTYVDDFKLRQFHRTASPGYVDKTMALPQEPTELMRVMGIRKNMSSIERKEAFHAFLLDRCAVELGVTPARFRSFLHSQEKAGKKEDTLRVLEEVLSDRGISDKDRVTADALIDFFNNNTCFGRDGSPRDKEGRIILGAKAVIADLEKESFDPWKYKSPRMVAARRDALKKIQNVLAPDDRRHTYVDGWFHNRITALAENLTG